MKLRFSIFLTAFAAAPAFAQDCANIPTSMGQVDMAYAHCASPMAPEAAAGPSDMGFGINNAIPEIMDFAQDAPETLNSLAVVSEADFWNAGDFEGDDLTTWYGLTSNGEAYSVDAATGTQTLLGTITPPTPRTWSGCTYDLADAQFYCTATDLSISSVSSVDFGALTSTVIGTDDGVSPGTIAVASNDTPETSTGLLYGYDVVNDNLVSIDKGTGAHTVIGPLGYDANFGQGMDFDMDDGTCYIYAFNNTTFVGELRTCDTSTGATTLVGVLGATVPGGLNQVGAGSSATQLVSSSISSDNNLPDTYTISDVYPNPFNPSSQFELSVSQEQHVTATLYNTLGQRVTTLLNGVVGANQSRQITIDGTGLASGLYIVRVQGENFTDTRHVTLLK